MGGKNADARAARKLAKLQQAPAAGASAADCCSLPGQLARLNLGAPAAGASAAGASAAETVDHSGRHALLCVKDANTMYLFAMECTQNAVLPCRYTCVHHLVSFKTTPSPDKMQMPSHGLTFAFMNLYALDLEIAPGKLSKKALDAGWNRHIEMTGNIAYIPKELNAAYPSSCMMREELVKELGMQKDSIVRVERVPTIESLRAKLATIHDDIVANCRVYVFD